MAIPWPIHQTKCLPICVCYQMAKLDVHRMYHSVQCIDKSDHDLDFLSELCHGKLITI